MRKFVTNVKDSANFAVAVNVGVALHPTSDIMLRSLARVLPGHKAGGND